MCKNLKYMQEFVPSDDSLFQPLDRRLIEAGVQSDINPSVVELAQQAYLLLINGIENPYKSPNGVCMIHPNGSEFRFITYSTKYSCLTICTTDSQPNSFNIHFLHNISFEQIVVTGLLSLTIQSFKPEVTWQARIEKNSENLKNVWEEWQSTAGLFYDFKSSQCLYLTKLDGFSDSFVYVIQKGTIDPLLQENATKTLTAFEYRIAEPPK